MTILEKNIAITEMLGAKIECVYHNTSTGFKMFQAVGDVVEKLRNYSNMPVGKHVTNGIDVANLEFHSNANWQFEALLFINRLGYEYELCSYLPNNQRHWCAINRLIDEESNSLETIIPPVEGDLPKEAIFEALYLMSQYLKTHNGNNI